jgi:hypothetical protein
MTLKTMSYSNFLTLARSFPAEKSVATATFVAILSLNNTPPATRKISALRGVTCLWGSEK